MIRVGATLLTTVVAGALLTQSASAQAAASPRDSVKATIAGATISIDYGRPFKRGRAIMDSLVPYGAVWRTGANKATHLTTTKSLMFGSAMIPPGTYTLYTVPGKDSWKLVINKETGQWGTSYDQAKDLARVDMKVEALPSVVEQFTIKLLPKGSNGVLRLEWDKTAAVAEFMVH